MTPVPMTALVPQLPRLSTLIVTMLGRVFWTAWTNGLRREYWALAWVAVARKTTAHSAASAARGVLFSMTVRSFRQPGDLHVSGVEAHGFPPPPRDGFSVSRLLIIRWESL